MSEGILSSRPGHRERLRFLGPGERIIDGRVCYSAAWLDGTPFEPESVEIEPAAGGKEGEEMEVTVRFTLEGRGDEQSTAEWIARPGRETAP